mmetsp:Transcript_22585/g.25954  ORF Transcript_22585/g.25954 Transcript_22585/m.25954 type:complete len:122 (-) Transcript_22585:16-381(-)
MVRNYLILRIVWDIILMLMNVVLIFLSKISFVSFLFNIIVVISLDGYFNFIVYGFFKLKQNNPEEYPFNNHEDVEANNGDNVIYPEINNEPQNQPKEEQVIEEAAPNGQKADSNENSEDDS